MDERPGFERHAVSLIIVSGSGAGEEFPVEAPRWVLGRGPGSDVRLEDPEVAPCHAALEYARGGFRLTDLGSPCGTRVNGCVAQSCEVAHGDRIALGAHVLQILIEERGA